MLICCILALHMTHASDHSLGQLRSIHAVFGPLLLWALIAAAYAFHGVVRAYVGLAGRLDRIVARDRTRAQRLISRIRERLASSDRSMRRLIELSQE